MTLRTLLRHAELSAEGLAAMGARAACDQEPIHRCGAIQPHGFLLAVDPGPQRIRAASANFLERHIAGADALGAAVEAILGADLAHKLRSVGAAAATPYETLPERVRCPGLGEAEYDLILHRRGALQLVELEEALDETGAADRDFLQRLYASGKALYAADTVERQCEVAVREVRRLSGFDRVMVYRFDADAHGVVVAEARADAAPPFLGLNYPASDIPRQARLLYLRNWIRVIPDCGYMPSPLVSNDGAIDEIDLSMAVLRSVSPYHIQYLHNMGVGATMTISLIVENQLWGMIACHHDTPKRVPHLKRMAFELFGQQLSVRLRAAELAGFHERAQGLARLSAQVLTAMAAAEDAVGGAVAARDALIGMVDADGAAISLEGKQVLLGTTPAPEVLEPLIEFFAARAGAGPAPWTTNHLTGLDGVPVAADGGCPAATGAMFLPLAGYGRNFVLWLRGERAASVRWAGRAPEGADETLVPLQPRASFAEWIEQVDGRSLPWRAEEVAVAAEFAQAIPEVLMHRAQNRLMRLALHDPLTGLPNRIHLLDRLEGLLKRGPSTDQGERDWIGVLFIDLDGFKAVNESMGHEAGDALLRHAARRMSDLLRPNDVVGRVGGDEFVVLVPQAGLREATAIAQRIVEAFRNPFLIDNQTGRFVTASVGVTVVGRGETPNEALRQADAAMYHAKRSGRDQAATYDPTTGASVYSRQVAFDELREAIVAGEIAPFFQAVYDITAAGAPILHGFEALARWRHSTRGVVPPGQFIALAEEAHLIEALGRSILRQSLDALRAWPDRTLVMAVNVSAQQLVANGFADHVLAALLEFGLAPARLCLEITESQVMQTAAQSLAALNRLQEAGVKIAIDDFGTGFCSLAYVRNLPAAILKIDRTFVMGLPNSPRDRAVVRATVQLAHALGMRVVAEGVETAAQLEHLRLEGADFAQGYLLGRPQPLESLTFGSLSALPSALAVA